MIQHRLSERNFLGAGGIGLLCEIFPSASHVDVFHASLRATNDTVAALLSGKLNNKTKIDKRLKK